MLCANVSEHYISSIFIGAVNKNNRDEVVVVFIQEKFWLKRSLGQDLIFSVILLVHTTYENVTVFRNVDKKIRRRGITKNKEYGIHITTTA